MSQVGEFPSRPQDCKICTRNVWDNLAKDHQKPMPLPGRLSGGVLIYQNRSWYVG